MAHDERHGGPYDRGAADFWYDRPFEPHYFVAGSYTSDRVPESGMTKKQVAAYRAGYDMAKAQGDQKDWG